MAKAELKTKVNKASVSAFIDKVDLAGRTITVDWGEHY